MKTTKLLVTAALLVASASVSFAGPGAQYWQQRRNAPTADQKQRAVAAAEKQTNTKEASATNTCACSCKAKG